MPDGLGEHHTISCEPTIAVLKLPPGLQGSVLQRSAPSAGKLSLETVRLLLQPFTQGDVGRLVFEYTDTGKPYIRHFPLFFNVSHSFERMVVAIDEYPVGIDIERVVDRDIGLICRRFFSPFESSYVCHEREGHLFRFYEVWTAKESYLKAVGSGLNGIKRCSVVSADGVFTVSEDPNWKIHRSLCFDDYVMSVCVVNESQLSLRDLMEYAFVLNRENGEASLD